MRFSLPLVEAVLLYLSLTSTGQEDSLPGRVDTITNIVSDLLAWVYISEDILPDIGRDLRYVRTIVTSLHRSSGHARDDSIDRTDK